jgi:hypothetical protein
MRVEFNITLDDCVDVELRALARNRVTRLWRWEGSILAGFLGGAALFLFIPESFGVKLAFGALGLIAGVVIFPLFYQRNIERKLRRYYRDQLGPEDSFPVQVQLCPGGLRVKQRGVESTLDWATVEGIEERHDSVDFLILHGRILAVRKRAFSSADAMGEFVGLAQRPPVPIENRLLVRKASDPKL